jgi:phenylalanyl-tRNA synthetase alpha chain
MFDKVKAEIELLNAIQISDKEALEKFRIEYLGTKGKLKNFFGGIKEVPNEQKKEYDLLVNELIFKTI